jgi:hypothetical protein
MFPCTNSSIKTELSAQNSAMKIQPKSSTCPQTFMESEPLGSHQHNQLTESNNSNSSTFTLPNITQLAPTKLDDHVT